MRITSLDAIPYALPFEKPYVTARGRLERREMLLVRLLTDEGAEGLGEAVPLSLRGGPSLGEIERELRDSVAPALIGTDPREASAAGGRRPGATSAQAAAAVEIARLDLAAKLADIPLWQLFGAEEARPVHCNATLVAGLPRVVASSAESWAERGFRSFKVKVGTPQDVAQVEAVRAAVGPRARIRVDANGVWSPREAVERLDAMEAFGLELAEQPAADLEDLALVRGQTAIPIAADESITDATDARRALELAACQLGTVKLAKVGGVGPALAIADLLPVYLSSALDGPVGIAAAAHLAQALPGTGVRAGLAHGLATQLLFADTIASVECELRDGCLHTPAGPGLGVRIDEQALERHRI
jgi:L-alanine-DL-glutamate epimerase-like enolase superfamily enzyme